MTIIKRTKAFLMLNENGAFKFNAATKLELSK